MDPILALIIAPVLWAITNVLIVAFSPSINPRSWYWQWGIWIPVGISVGVCSALWIRVLV